MSAHDCGCSLDRCTVHGSWSRHGAHYTARCAHGFREITEADYFAALERRVAAS